MKKAGYILVPLGIIFLVLGIIAIEKTGKEQPWPYFVLMFGLISTFLGISFLFFDLPYEKRKNALTCF